MSRDDNPPGAPPLERTEVVPPQRVVAGKYRLGRQIGEGGMGAVYEALHVGLGSKVAVKVLSEQLAENPTFVRRFRREARASAAVQHENVVAVTDTGEDENGVPYLVMALLEGETLAATLRRERVLIPQVAAEVTAQMLKGLGAAHEKGVIHRDLKPGNIFLARQADGTYRVKVLDFGISKFSADVSNLNVTVEGTIVGTPNFMAPEQVMGKHDVDGRADLYAVGVMMYRMLTGKLPYAGTSSKEVYDKIIQGAPLKPHQIRPDIPAALESVVMKAMARKAADRFQSAEEFLEGLRAAVPSLDTGASRPSLPAIPSLSPSHEDDPDEPRTRSSAPTRTDRPAPGDSLRRITTPLAPAYDPEADPLKSLPNAQAMARRGPTRVNFVLGLLLLGALGAALYFFLQSQVMPGAGPRTPDKVATGPAPLRYVVRNFASPEVVRAQHEPIVRYLEKELGRPVVYEARDEYERLDEEIEKNPPVLAAMPAYAYVKAAKRRSGPRLLARVIMDTGAFYTGAIVTKNDAAVQSLSDLKGKTFCFVGANSASGYLYPRALFLQAGVDPDEDLKPIHVGDHLASIKNLHADVCVGAAMYESLVYDAAKYGLPSEFKIVARTDHIPYDAYCMTRNSDPVLADEVERALLKLVPNGPETTRILGPTNEVRGFERASDEDYDSVREMVKYLDLAKNKSGRR